MVLDIRADVRRRYARLDGDIRNVGRGIRADGGRVRVGDISLRVGARTKARQSVFRRVRFRADLDRLVRAVVSRLPHRGVQTDAVFLERSFLFNSKDRPLNRAVF